MAGGQKGQQTVVQEPWSGAKPYMTDLYKVASDTFKASTPFTGKSYVGPNDTQRGALKDIQSLAPRYGEVGGSFEAAGQGQRAGVDPVRALAGDTISGKYMDPDSNPFLKGAVKAAQHDTFRNFWEGTMPAIKSSALANGTYGGDRTDLVMSRAMEGALSDAHRQAAGIYYNNYDSERNRQMASPGLYGQANALDTQGLNTILQGLGIRLQGPQRTGQTGDQEQAWGQSEADAARVDWERGRNDQWDPIAKFLSTLTGGGFNSQTQTVPRSTSMFQGAAGGAGLGYQMGQRAGMDPQTAALIASLFGGASGY